MKQKHKNKSRLYIVVVLAAAVAGFILAKVAPMEAGHGFSAVFDKGTEQKTKATTTTTTKEKNKQIVVKKLSYSEQVNEALEQGKFINRLPIKLLLQTDERWKDTAYGVGNPDGNSLEINGCAILSLAMVSSYLDSKDYTPQDILNWSQNNYYIENEGTSWQIFYDFAQAKGYQYQDLGIDIAQVEDQLKQQHPIIVSVKPGRFTETGHIMVISGTDNGKFWLNDPNDSETKGHSQKEFTADELMNEAVNFWAIYK
ncbi:peptidase C39 family protein [Erwinia sp. CPCC 100877]|nr:peptidase C39 family protein [Erwinia sp. CPCC 100877]